MYRFIANLPPKVIAVHSETATRGMSFRIQAGKTEETLHERDERMASHYEPQGRKAAGESRKVRRAAARADRVELLHRSVLPANSHACYT